jgi:hypothetical protein
MTMLTFKRCLSAASKLAPAAVAALLVASCGGGGVSSSPTGGPTPLSLNPNAANFYANVPVTITIAGGSPPYLLSTTEPTVLPGINGLFTRNGSITVVPAQPGVVDPVTDPNIVPSRSLTLQVRDATGTTITGAYKVLVNYALGYGTSITNLSPGLAEQSCGSATNVCAGQDAVVRLSPTYAGISRAGRQIKLDIIQGDYDFMVTDTNLTKTVTLTSDADGEATVKIRARAGAPTQIAILRITDVQSGATRDEVFTIASAVLGEGIITAIPTQIGFSGATKAGCATNLSADIYLYGGKAPYTIRNTSPDVVVVSGSPVLTNGGRFTITSTGRVCTNDEGIQLVVVDATGRQITVRFVNKVGENDAPPPFIVTPASLSFVGCSSAVTTVVSTIGAPYVSISEPSFSASQPQPVAGFPGLYSVTISRNTNCAGGIAPSPVTSTPLQCVTANGIATFVGGGIAQNVALTGSCPAPTTTTTTASITVPTTALSINQCGTAPVTFIAQGLTANPLVTLNPALANAGFTVTQPTNGAGAGQLTFNITRSTQCAAAQCVPVSGGVTTITAQTGATGSPANINVTATCNP